MTDDEHSDLSADDDYCDCDDFEHDEIEEDEDLNGDEELCHQRRDDATAINCPPPVSEVSIPLAHMVRQGLVEMSIGEWKYLYLSTHKDVEQLQTKLSNVSEENRLLKRQLIEMQKQLFEVRRNKRRSPDHETWSIPDYYSNSSKTPISNASSSSSSQKVVIHQPPAEAPSKTVSYDEGLTKKVESY